MDVPQPDVRSVAAVSVMLGRKIPSWRPSGAKSRFSVPKDNLRNPRTLREAAEQLSYSMLLFFR